jgi:hypothetical protein
MQSSRRKRAGSLIGAIALVGATLTGVALADEHQPAPRDNESACPEGEVEDAGFVDVAGTHEDAVECLAWYGITRGRTADRYDPSAPVKRANMAVFLARTIGYVDASLLPDPPADPDPFEDVDPQEFAGLEIAQLAELQVAHGRTATTYEPSLHVTRAQMASFVARMLSVLGADTTGHQTCTFTDEASIPEPHRANVHALCGLGIAVGAVDGSFNPNGDIRRDQMAAYLTRALDVLVEQGLTEPPSARDADDGGGDTGDDGTGDDGNGDDGTGGGGGGGTGGDGTPSEPVRALHVDSAECEEGTIEEQGTEDNPFCEIQEAVDVFDADTYDHIAVASGDGYEERVTISDEVTIIGDDEMPELLGGFDVTGDAVAHIESFDVTADDTTSAGTETVGVYAAGASDVTLVELTITGDDSGRGVLTEDGSDTTVTLDGVEVEDFATCVMVNPTSGEVTIESSTLTGCDAGVGIDSDGGVTITDTDLVDNAEGVGIGTVADPDATVSITDNRFTLEQADPTTVEYVHDYTGTADLQAILDANIFDPEGRIVGNAIIPIVLLHVDSTGCDENGGVRDGSEEDPFCEIQEAVDVFDADTYDHIAVASGDGYEERVTISDEVTIIGDDEMPELLGGFDVTGDAVAHIESFDVTADDTTSAGTETVGVYAAGASDVTLVELTITGDDSGRGVLTEDGSDTTVTLDGVEVEDFATCVMVNPTSGEVTIESSTLTGCDAGVGIDSDGGVTITDTDLVDNAEGVGIGTVADPDATVSITDNRFTLEQADPTTVEYVHDYTGTADLQAILDANIFDPEGRVDGNAIVPAPEE